MNLSVAARHWLGLPAIVLCSMLSPAATAQTGEFAAQELLRQQQRERALREQQEPSPELPLPPTAPEKTERLPEAESPCFPIDAIVLKSDTRQFDWALAAADPADDPASGRCLGGRGINLVMKRIQNAIIERGFVTTRVLAEAQDLETGVLVLTVIAGRIRAIRFSGDSGDRAKAIGAVPARPGELLNLRDIEQALENFKRVPTAEADIEIVPGEQPGESDLVITWKQAVPLRQTISADDGGLETTGKYLGSVTLAVDHPLGLNDLFYASFNHDLGGGQRGERGTKGYTAHYSLPWNYWLVGATASANRYHQTVAGASQSYDYSGTSESYEIRLTRTLRRDATSRSWASLRGYLSESSNFIDDTEVEVQRRRMAGWEAALGHRAFIAKSTVDLKLAYRRGTGAFAALPAPEQDFGEGTARPIIVTAEAQLSLPFMLGGQRLRFNSDWRVQWNRTPLVPQDRFAIGGRYTVRGFDGESVLLAERGWLVRNDLGIALGDSELYAGVDYGEVGGQSAALLVGTRLSGAVIGVRGSYRKLYYDLFAGRPLDKPQGFETADITTGFNLTLSF